MAGKKTYQQVTVKSEPCSSKSWICQLRKKIVSETVLDMTQPSLCDYSEKARAHYAHNIVPRIKFGGVFVFIISLTSI